MTTEAIGGGEQSRRVPAALVECGRESGRCFFELAGSGLALGSLSASPLDHPFIVNLGGSPSERSWKSDVCLTDQPQLIEPLLDSIACIIKCPDGKINPVSLIVV